MYPEQHALQIYREGEAVEVELRSLTVEDGFDVYNMLQEIPGGEKAS